MPSGACYPYPPTSIILIASRYLSFILLLVPLALSKHMLLYPRDTHAFSQSYYYAIISASVYCIISTLLLANLLGNFNVSTINGTEQQAIKVRRQD